MRTFKKQSGEAGWTLQEAAVSAAILGGVVLASISLFTREAQTSRSSISVTVAQTQAQTMLFTLEKELANARGTTCVALLGQAIGPSATASIPVDSTAGFPPQGLLLVDRGTNQVERIAYDGLADDGRSFLGLARGAQCTTGFSHAQGAEALWGGLAQVLALGANPPANLWDGRAQVSGATQYFRGDGSGFSYRVPTDPDGGDDYLNGDTLQWGARVDGVPSLTGWAALCFEAREEIQEATSQTDLNRDGDRTDVFEVGQIVKRTWSTDAPGAASPARALGPTVILQERCNWGGDLDGDGFDDPLFLWDEANRRLTVRLHVLGRSTQGDPVVRRVESTVFLRNEVTD